MAVIGGITLKGRHVVIPESLQKQALEQLHVNHTGIKKQIPGMQINLLGKHEH